MSSADTGLLYSLRCLIVPLFAVKDFEVTGKLLEDVPSIALSQLRCSCWITRDHLDVQSLVVPGSDGHTSQGTDMSLKRVKGRLLVFLGEATLQRSATEPYVRIKLGRHVRKTSPFHGSSMSPHWSEELSFGFLDEATPAMKLELREHALIGKGKRLASVWVPVSPPPVGRTNIAWALKGEPMGSITLEVRLDEENVPGRSSSVTREVSPAPGSFGGERASAAGSANNANNLSLSVSFDRRNNGSERRSTWTAARTASPVRSASVGAASAVPPSVRAAISPVRFNSLPHSSPPSPDDLSPRNASSTVPPLPSASSASVNTSSTSVSSSPRGVAPAAASVTVPRETSTSLSVAGNNSGLGGESVAWLLDHKYMAMPALIGILILMSLLTIIIIVRFLRLEASLDRTIATVAQCLAEQHQHHHNHQHAAVPE